MVTYDGNYREYGRQKDRWGQLLAPVASSRFSEKLCLARPASVPSKSFGGVIEAVVLAAIGVSTSLLYPPLVLQASCY